MKFRFNFMLPAAVGVLFLCTLNLNAEISSPSEATSQENSIGDLNLSDDLSQNFYQNYFYDDCYDPYNPYNYCGFFGGYGGGGYYDGYGWDGYYGGSYWGHGHHHGGHHHGGGHHGHGHHGGGHHGGGHGKH